MEALVLGLPLGFVVGLLPAFPLLGFLLNGLIALLCRSRRRAVPEPLVSAIGVFLPSLSFVLSLVLFSITQGRMEGMMTSPLWIWIASSDLIIPVSFKVDRLSLVMALTVTGVGSLIHLYSVGYMKGDRGFARYFAFLNLFLFAMLVLVLAGNLPLLFVGWEGVGLCSYLLIGFWFTDPAKAYVAKKAFVINRIGDLGFLIGMFLLYATLKEKGIESADGLLSFDLLQQYRGELMGVATLASLLLFAGAVGKSAQIPLYVWLPDAMAGPTPVSALIHAATMVTAGVYMVARLHFLFTLSPLAMQVVAVVGISTAVLGAVLALAQRDIKKVLAYSTISQLGTMFLAVGIGAFTAGIFHLVTHAFFKACLFLGAGSVIHALDGEQDIWKMGLLRKKMPITFLAFASAVIAIVGVFPFAGFFSKDAILFETFLRGHPRLWGIAFLTAGITAFYMCRMFALIFLGTDRLEPEKRYHLHESPPSMTVPLLLLAILSLVGGWIAIPEVLHGGHRFFGWLGPMFRHTFLSAGLEESSHALELLLAIVTLVWVFHIGLLTTILYSQKLPLIERVGTALQPLIRILVERSALDTLYHQAIVHPIRWVSERVLWQTADLRFLDRFLVRGSARAVAFVGRSLALLQTGVVQGYALFFALGALLVIAMLTL